MTPNQISKVMELADRYRDLKVGEGTAQARTALRAYLLSTIKKTLTVQPDNMPDCWVVVKDGKILGTHNEPAHIDGLQAVRYAPAQPKRKPLTDNAIQDLGFNYLPNSTMGEFTAFARTIEAAHGIGDKT